MIILAIADRFSRRLTRQLAGRFTNLLLKQFAAAAALAYLGCAAAWAQSSCSSDGQRAPAGLVERFVSADCATCWADPASARPGPRMLALDWIVPTPQGDDAPLSAAASRDAVQRLASLSKTPPGSTGASTVEHRVRPGSFKLRVARGVALGGYMGVSIELMARRGTPLPSQPLTAWLLLVEDVPAGTDGTPVPRMLVRNAITSTWNNSGSSPKRLFESRPMSIPDGANPERLRAVGWVEDARGQVVASAASVCND